MLGLSEADISNMTCFYTWLILCLHISDLLFFAQSLVQYSSFNSYFYLDTCIHYKRSEVIKPNLYLNTSNSIASYIVTTENKHYDFLTQDL